MLRKIAVLAALVIPQPILAQNPLSEQRQVEIGLGLATPFLQSGSELARARAIRAEEQSYFERADGTRRDVGSYPALFGFSLNLGFHQPVERVGGLMWGGVARTTLTGSQPSAGGYAEGYFFNSVVLALAGKYYLAERSGLFLRAEAGLGAVLTKNRFLNDAGEQNYFHQFGIGPGAAFGVGHSFAPFAGRATLVDVQLVYQQLRTRVEVDGTGDDRWNTGALHLVVSAGL